MSIIKDLELARQASLELNLIDEAKINAVLRDIADAAETQTEQILQANAQDLACMDRQDPMYDRLMLTPERLAGIAADMRNVASLPSPLDQVLSDTTRPNGMRIKKVSVPFGVIGIIYEARPNVSFDVFSLCFKSGSACVLKGGHDAANSNEAIVKLIRKVLRAHKLDEHLVTLLSNNRAATTELLQAVGYVDLIIPRGSKGLIDFVRQNARVPVIETGAGICHRPVGTLYIYSYNLSGLPLDNKCNSDGREVYQGGKPDRQCDFRRVQQDCACYGFERDRPGRHAYYRYEDRAGGERNNPRLYNCHRLFLFGGVYLDLQEQKRGVDSQGGQVFAGRGNR